MKCTMCPVFVVQYGVVAMVVAAAAPSGGTTSGGTASPATTIAIVGELGSQSFSPNPVVVGTNGTVVWQNTDGVAHRIVFND